MLGRGDKMFTTTRYIIFIWNIFVLLLYGLDKFKAKRSMRRIKETTLIVPAFLLGGVGAMFGMVLFNHKTSKTKFRILVPLSVILNVITIYFIVITMGEVI